MPDNASKAMLAEPAARPRRAGRRSNGPVQAGAAAAAGAPDPAQAPVVDLERYTPAYFTFIANKLARGASAAYLDLYGVGIESWRVMVMLASEGRVTAQRVVQLIGMDKASVSRTFKAMHDHGLLRFESDPHDGRLRHASFTPKGRALHDRIVRLALLREQVALSVLSASEVQTLRELLRRVHENLPAVETATDAFIAREREALGRGSALRRRGRKPSPT